MEIKRKYSEISEVVDDSRIKGSSRTPSGSESTNTNIGNLPDQLLVDILCRLPSSKYASQCKLVSKRWCTLLADRYFISCFVCHKSGQKQTPEMQTLINCQGEEFLTRMSSSLKALHGLFTKLMSFHHLKEEPVVVGAFNDLVLCCANLTSQRDYYICNPITDQVVTLPPPPQLFPFLLVGFICNLPYYNCKEDNQGGHVIQVNAEYNCKVVRLVCPEDQRTKFSNKLKVQIFTSDTGEWRELIFSSPSEFKYSDLEYSPGYACNGKLYWMGGGKCTTSDRFVIGLDPFVIDHNTSSTAYACDFITIDKMEDYMCLGVSKGFLKLVDYDFETSLCACDLNVDQMARVHGEGADKVLEDMKNIYRLDEKMFADVEPMDNLDYIVDLFAFDPSNEDVIFLLLYQDIIVCNIRTREWSKIDDEKRRIHDLHIFFPLALPWWPSPLPRLPHNASVSPTFQEL